MQNNQTERFEHREMADYRVEQFDREFREHLYSDKGSEIVRAWEMEQKLNGSQPMEENIRAQLDYTARNIVRGTTIPTCGWYDSPDDLERIIREKLYLAYQIGAERCYAWMNLAIKFASGNLPCVTKCLDYDPAGKTYTVQPSPDAVEAWRAVLPDIDPERDFWISPDVNGHTICCLTEDALRRAKTGTSM